MPKSPRSVIPPAPPGDVRIIGGCWRGRRIRFSAEPGLRPTPGRVRETLFNWLQPWIEGSRCLDLFCGSGALGLEALSRGAASATLVELSPVSVRELRANIALLGAATAEAVQAEALAWITAAGSRRYDIAFIDAPFQGDFAARAVARLAASPLLVAPAFVYVEMAASAPPLVTPAGWELYRDKTAGTVAYRLYRVGVDADLSR